MTEPRAQRTLVKSPPELWAEISDVSALARHLGALGEIRITRLEAETTVAWEGDRARGTVELEPSGWGTKVTLSAEPIAAEAGAVEAVEVEVEAEPEAEAVQPEPAEPEPEAVVDEPEAVVDEPEPVAIEPATEPPQPERLGLFARLFRRRRKAVPAEPEPAAVEPEPVAVEPEPVAVEPEPVAVEPEPEPVAVEPEPEPIALAAEPVVVPEPMSAEELEALLVGVLDDLGSAHHRPFSRG